jgi:TMEM175 potassium channel family protein
VRSPAETHTVSTSRLESFSDGVIAVAITLLVLNITVPPPSSHRTLTHELLKHWPEYAAYVTSFITIGIIWINHHAMISRLRAANHTILILNLMLLMSIVVLPFTTSLMATYLKAGRGESVAAGVYSGSLLVMALAFVALNRYILLRSAHLLGAELDEDTRRTILTRSLRGVLPYVVATALAPVSASLTLAICAAIAGYYALPVASGNGATS